ncbi:MAG: hypothetical protein ACKVX7_05815, partial [Planctomycetota bacterium]
MVKKLVRLTLAALLACLSTSGIYAQPANNDCADATPLTTGVSAAFSSVGATNDGPLMTCGGPTTAPLDVWFSWTADCTGTAVFNMCGSNYDTRISVYPAGCPATGALGCNDDAAPCGLDSILNVAVTSGTAYLIQVAGFVAAVGDGVIVVTCIPPATNDLCSAPVSLTTGVSAAFTTLGAAADGPAFTCGTAGTSPDIWFTWTADCTVNARVSTCGSTLNTRLQIFDIAAGCPPVGAPIVCNDAGACGLSADVIFTPTLGTTYLIQVASSTTTATGVGSIVITCITPPPNDECSAPIALTVGAAPTAFDTIAAVSSTTLFACGTAGVGIDLWYSFTASCPVNTRVSTCGSTLNTRIQIFDAAAGCPPVGLPLICNDAGTCGTAADVIFTPVTGATYLIQLAGNTATAVGAGTIAVSCSAPPANDSCSTPDTVVDGAQPFTNILSTPDGPTGFATPLCTSWAGGGASLNNNVWYIYTATATGTLQVDTCTAPAFDTKLAVYPGTVACPPLLADVLACNDDGAGCPSFASLVTVPVTMGQQYLIELGGFTATTFGSGTLTLSYFVGPVTGLSCSATPAGAVTLNWTNGAVYDSVNIYLNGLLNQTLPGSPTSASLTGLSGANEICVEGVQGGVITAQVCCDVLIPVDYSGEVLVYQGELPSDTDSFAAVVASLTANGITATTPATIGEIGGTPDGLFLILGTFPDDHNLTVAEGQLIADLVSAGVPVYAEAGDTWGFNPVTPFDTVDGVDPVATQDGNDTVTMLAGADYGPALYGAFAGPNGYTQDQLAGNDWTDQLVASTTDIGGPNV